MNKRSILLIGLCMVICTYGVKAEELGGFFVEIEPGQSSQYPEQWYDQPQTSHEVIPEEDVYCQPGEQIYDQNIERIPECQNPLPPVTYINIPTPDSFVDIQPSVFVYTESVLLTVTPVPTLMPIAVPSSMPSSIPTKTQAPTETPIPTATPVPLASIALVSETKRVKELQDKERKLEVCYFSTTIGGKDQDLKNIEIKVKSKYPVYVWSIRINKQEQKWSWKKGQTIVVEDVKKNRNYNLEMLLFCEKKDKIQVFIDDMRK